MGGDSRLRDAVTGGEPIHPSIYQRANRASQEVVQYFYNTAQRNDARNYDHVPSVAHYLTHLGLVSGGGSFKTPPAVKFAAGTEDKKPAAKEGAGIKKKNEQRDVNTTASQREDLKAKGFLVWTGSPRMPPMCPVYAKLPGMRNEERICLLFCAKGCSCTSATAR